MKGISSDVTALAAVLGSAAVAGVVTLALAGRDSVQVAHECITTEVEAAPRVVVALNSGHAAVVMAPHVRTGSAEVCERIFLRRVRATRTSSIREPTWIRRERVWGGRGCASGKVSSSENAWSSMTVCISWSLPSSPRSARPV